LGPSPSARRMWRAAGASGLDMSISDMSILDATRARTVDSLLSGASRLQRVQQPPDFVFFRHHVKPPVHIVGHERRLRLADGFAAHDFLLHSVEARDGALAGEGELRVG